MEKVELDNETRKNVENILGLLQALERHEEEQNLNRCEKERWEREQVRGRERRGGLLNGLLDSNRSTPRFNIIPGGIPGDCQSILVVGNIWPMRVELRILEAFKHIQYTCKKTKCIIFWADAWNMTVWRRHQESFNVAVYLKMVDCVPIRLK